MASPARSPRPLRAGAGVAESHDYLNAGSDAAFARVVDVCARAEGRASASASPGAARGGAAAERVLFSDIVVKINRKDKEQKRSLVITELAVYNLSADRSLTLKRRIPIDGLAGVSDSDVSDEFVLHVPAEYDYRLVTPRKAAAIDALRAAAVLLGLPPLIVSPSSLSELKGVVLTRVQAGLRRTPSGLGGVKLLVKSPKAAGAGGDDGAGELSALSLADAASPQKSLKKTRADSARVLVVKAAATPPPIGRKLSAADFSFAPSPDIGDLRPIREGDDDDDDD